MLYKNKSLVSDLFDFETLFIELKQKVCNRKLYND